MTKPPSAKIKTGAVLVVLGVAVALWVGVLLWQQSAGRVRTRVEAGMEFARKGDAPNAEREWREALRLNPTYTEVWMLLGELYMQSEQWTKGAEAFQQVRKLEPNAPHVNARLAACLLRTGDEQQAMQYAKEELKHDPNEAGSLMILAFLSAMQGDEQSEIEYLQRLRKTAPDDVETLEMLAKVLLSQNRYDDLKIILERLLAVAPKHEVGFALRGVMTLEVDASEQGLKSAEADLLKALELDPLYLYARFNLGKVYVRQRNYPEAVRQLEFAERMNAHVMDIPFELTTAYARLNQPKKAAAARKRFETLRAEANLLSSLQKRCANERDNFALHLQVGKLYLQRDEFRQALTFLGRALQLRPDDKDAQDAYQKLQAKLDGSDPRQTVWKKTQPAASSDPAAMRKP